MRDDALGLPRFERVLVVGPDAEIQRVYEGNDLDRIYDGKGSIKLEDAEGVKVPPRDSGKRVTIITERSEIVNVPGYYYLVMRELTARDEGSDQPAVKVVISELPADIDAEVTTYFAPHRFTAADQKETVWVLDHTLLPGQGLTVVFKPRVMSPPPRPSR